MRARNYILLVVLGVVPAAAMLVLVAAESGASELIPVAPLPLVIPAIAMLVFVYKMWAAIQDGQTKPSAGLALGLSLVPLVNIFWVPAIIGSWPRKAMAFAERKGRKLKVKRGAFITFVVLVYLIPVLVNVGRIVFEMRYRFRPIAQGILGFAVLLIVLEVVLYFVVIVRVCRAVTELKRAG